MHISNKKHAAGETSARGERMLLQEINSERRKHRRYFFPALIECCRFRTGTDDIFRALIFNASRRGLCIRLDRSIAEGQKIEVVKCIYPSFYGTATVRWLNKIEEDSYVAGLTYDPSR
jgi:hypothetical protein